MDRLISLQAALEHIVHMELFGRDFPVVPVNVLKALPSAQPDLITKIQNGIKVTDADDVYSCGMRNGMRWCISLIDDKEPLYENCTSAQPEQQWIPCSDTVDIPEHEVLCCDKYGEELIGWLSCEDDQWLCESDCEMMYDPIAWRELPEPWREEE